MSGHTKWSVVRAGEHLHRARHRAAGDDPRSAKLLVWTSLLELREAKLGELHPNDWTSLMNRIVTAIDAGRPVWPVYAAAKRRWRPA